MNPPPVEMPRSSLHAYQIDAIGFALDRGRCSLWMGLGLGKTAVALTALADLIRSCSIRRALVIAPLQVARCVWAVEALRWEHLQTLRFAHVLGDAAERSAALCADADVWIVNRENVPWLVRELGPRWPFDAVIVDESTSFKSPSAKRFRALRSVLPATDRMILLTGTPASEGIDDLWAPQFLVDRGAALGRTFGGFRMRFMEPDRMGWAWTPRSGAREEVRRLLAPTVLSMSAEDHLDLPELVEVTVPAEFSPSVASAYRKFRRDRFLELPGWSAEAASAGVLAGKLLQFCQGALYRPDGSWEEIHTAKLDTLSGILEDNRGENLLVAYRYRSDLERLTARFPEAVPLDGPASVDAWNRGEVRVLLVHPQSAGRGLNLQGGGSVLVWFGLEWSAELYGQMIGRLRRQGQRSAVRIVRIAVPGTFDERVLEVLASKAADASALMSALGSESAA